MRDQRGSIDSQRTAGVVHSQPCFLIRPRHDSVRELRWTADLAVIEPIEPRSSAPRRNIEIAVR